MTFLFPDLVDTQISHLPRMEEEAANLFYLQLPGFSETIADKIGEASKVSGAIENVEEALRDEFYELKDEMEETASMHEAPDVEDVCDLPSMGQKFRDCFNVISMGCEVEIEDEPDFEKLAIRFVGEYAEQTGGLHLLYGSKEGEGYYEGAGE